MLKHVVHRIIPRLRMVKVGDRLVESGQVAGSRTEIACEVPVCPDCRDALLGGCDLRSMMDHFRRSREEFVSLPEMPWIEPKAELPTLQVSKVEVEARNAPSEAIPGRTMTGAAVPLRQLVGKLSGPKVRPSHKRLS